MIASNEPAVDPVLHERNLPRSPYRGIESFRFIDEPIFCAREAETRRLRQLVTIYRGVLLYGASGSGKSSLINAGLMPELFREAFFVERIRVQPLRDEEMIIERIPLTPDGLPPYLPSIFNPEEHSSEGVRGFFEKMFSSSEGGDPEARIVLSVENFVARLRERAQHRPTLLIFDQFEEFVTLFEEAPQVQSLQEARDTQTAILKALVDLLRDHTLPVKLLFAFREDYFARLNILFRKCPDLTDQYLLLTSPDKAALLDIVRGPFRSKEAREHFGRELSDEVASVLAAEIDQRAEGDLLNLSEVEIVCDRLWHSEDPVRLLRSRRAQGLLEDYLAAELDRLQNLRDTAVALLSLMVTAGGTRNVISEEDLLSQVAKEEKLPFTDLQSALQILEKDTRLVRREQRNRVYFYEIVSEFLVPWIFRQKELRKEERERRKFRRKVLGMATIVCMFGLGAWAWQAKTLSETALKQSLDATSQQLRNTKDTLSLERTRFQETSERQAQQIVVKDEKIREADQREKSLNANIIQLNDQIASQRKAAQEQTSNLERQLQEGRQHIAQLQQNLQAEQAERSQAQQQAHQFQQNLQAEQADNARLSQQVGQLQGDLRNQQTENSRLRQQNEELAANVSSRQTENTRLRQQAEQLQNALETARSTAQERLARIGQLNADLKRTEGAFNACRLEKETLNGSLEQSKIELGNCQAQRQQTESPPPP